MNSLRASALLLFLASSFRPSQQVLINLTTNVDNKEEVQIPDFDIPLVGSVNALINRSILETEAQARDAVKICHRLGIRVKYRLLRDEVVECQTTSIKLITNEVARIMASIRKEDLDIITQSVIHERPLTNDQKHLLIQQMFSPFCSVLLPALQECDNTKYSTVLKAAPCWKAHDKDFGELTMKTFQDMCRNNGRWSVDFLESRPLRCGSGEMPMRQSDLALQRLDYIEKLNATKMGQNGYWKFDSYTEFCAATEALGVIAAETWAPSCKENKKPGQIFYDAFRDTRSFWNSKCGLAQLTHPSQTYNNSKASILPEKNPKLNIVSLPTTNPITASSTRSGLSKKIEHDRHTERPSKESTMIRDGNWKESLISQNRGTVWTVLGSLLGCNRLAPQGQQIKLFVIQCTCSERKNKSM